MTELLQVRFILLPLAALFGAVFGSFATALIYRLPNEINWVTKRSECTKCHHKLGALDLFPIISYLISGGKCRYCKTKFGSNYFWIEILMVITFTSSAYFFGPSFKAVIISLLGFACIIICAIDFEHYIIPDEMNILVFTLGIIYGIYNDAGLDQLILMPACYLGLALFLRYFMFAWKKKEGLGLGDVKFFLAAGSFLNIEILPVFLLFSGLCGIINALCWRLMKKGEIFPFGPSLSISLLFCVAYPESETFLTGFVQDYVYR